MATYPDLSLFVQTHYLHSDQLAGCLVHSCLSFIAQNVPHLRFLASVGEPPWMRDPDSLSKIGVCPFSSEIF